MIAHNPNVFYSEAPPKAFQQFGEIRKIERRAESELHF